MRYAVVIILAVMMAGCDGAPAALGSNQPSAGRGKYTGRCFPVKNNSALETLGNSIAPTSFGVGEPENNRTVYRVWFFLGDPRDAEDYYGLGPYPNTYLDAYGRVQWHQIQVYVVATSESFVQMEREGRRVCVGDLIRPGRDSVTWRATGYYWGTLR